MKTKFVIGMALATTMAFSTSFAAPGGAVAKPAREALVDYAKQIKETAFGKGMTAKGLNAQQLQVAQDRLINELQLPSGKNNSLSMALKSDSSLLSQRLDNLATIVAAKKMAGELAKTDPAHAKLIEEATVELASLMADSALTGARKSSKELNSTELADTTAALVKLESLPEIVLTRFNKAELEALMPVLKEYRAAKESKSQEIVEELFVQSIMTAKKDSSGKPLSREKALEIVRKLKECV